jgi:hypothetical protein
MSPRSLFRSVSNSSSPRRISAASSGEIVSPPGRGIASSKRSSWRRDLSTKARPSAYVIVAGTSPNLMTLELDIDASYGVVGLRSVSASRIVAGRAISAKQINRHLAGGRGGVCDISARPRVSIGQVQRWYAAFGFDAKCRNALFAVLNLLRGKGDLSIRLTSSTGGGASAAFTTTSRAVAGRS